MPELLAIHRHLYLVDHGSQINGSHGFTVSRLYDTYHQFLLIVMNMSMCMCLSVLYLWYTTTYKYISMSHTRSIFNPTLQPWIAIVIINVFITTLTRRISVLKAQKYCAHTASHSVSHSPALVSRGYTAILCREGDNAPCAKIVVWLR